MKEQVLHYAEKIYLRLAERWGNDFITLHKRPIHPTPHSVWSDPSTCEERVALVMQGPLLLKNDFTLETLRLYRETFSETDLILSTWKGEDAATLAKIRDLGVTVIENDKPEMTGIGNVNFQIVSTQNGITEAKARGAAYALKTRTDQRMYAPNIRAFLLNLIDTFPMTPGSTQKKRIIVSNFVTFKYRPYSPTDMLMFGTLDDMLLYWTPPLQLKPKANHPSTATLRDWMALDACEFYLTRNFLERIGRPITGTLTDSWRVYADHFCVADTEVLDTYWPKYEPKREYRYRTYSDLTSDRLLDFSEWLHLYTYRDTLHAPEEVLDQALGARVPHPV